MKKKLIILLTICTLALGVTGCASKTTENQASDTTTKNATTNVSNANVKADTTITLGDTIEVSGAGATVNNNIVTITTAGTYSISGTLKEGQIIVSAGEEDNVKLLLNGANITCSNSAPIYISSAKNAYVILADGTENSLTDGANYTFADSSTDEPNATLFSKDDLIIQGNGSLNINANYKHGIASKDDLEIDSGNITVTSVGDGIKGKDSITVASGNITINAQGDGMQSTNSEDTTKGNIDIKGGTFNINATLDGIQAENTLTIADGTINVTTGGGNANSSKTSSNWGMWGNNNTASSDTTNSAKGLKATSNIAISGGTINIDSSDDAIHSNKDLTIDGGNITIASGDDGIHSDSNLTINNGEINITKSYEGIESENITINDGTIHLVSSDDGLNASGGNDGSSMNGRPGQNSFGSTGSGLITINGGYVYVDASGDGIDANGSIKMTGGTAIVNGPTDNGNGPLDYDVTFDISGGLLIAAGSSGMAMSPSQTSSQSSIMVGLSSQEANTIINITSASGDEILTFAPDKQYSSVVVSSANIKNGETYTVSTGGNSTGTAKDGLYTDGKYSGGSEVGQGTVSSVVTQIGNVSGGMGPGGMMQGGNKGPRQ